MSDQTTHSPSRFDAIESRLGLLEDRQAIHEVILRYCRGVDRSDPELILSAFHDDAIDNHFGVVLPFREAIATLKAARSGAPPSITSSMHNICNVLIELDGDVARCESYLIVIVRIPRDGGDIDWLHAGRYVDRFERRNGEWRIAYRTVVYDIERFDEVVPAPGGLSQAGYLNNAVRGKRGSGDFSYEIFRRE
ncbi:MAG TPA: nuclear transport factor 2 family protein [Steroidobacteraceae bacterium]|nr:nuclear transport factor 2 family protein [Steroidobacteraceae bacterium]